MIIASRPVDLLPCSGFWYQMAKVDLFDLRLFDRIHAVSPQRRVMMRGRWATMPVLVGPAGALISDARIVPVETARTLTAVITERYAGARHWSTRGAQVLDMIDQAHTEHLWQFNLHLILGIREMLDIRTPISISRAPVDTGGAALASVMSAYQATSYLSDTAGRAYIGGDESYECVGINIVWSAHRPVTGDSILSLLMDYDDPMSVVMAEDAPARLPRMHVGAGA